MTDETTVETPEQELARITEELKAANQYLAKELRAMCGCSAAGKARNKARNEYKNNVIAPLQRRKAELEAQLGGI